MRWPASARDAVQALTGDHHDVARLRACPISVGDRCVEAHREAVILLQPPGDGTDRHLDPALPDPELLMNAYGARTALVGDACTSRQRHLDDLNGEGKFAGEMFRRR